LQCGFLISRQAVSLKLPANVTYWLYRKRRETRDMMAYLLARKRVRPSATFSIIALPCSGVPLITVVEFVASLEAQTYKNWQLCICGESDANSEVWNYFEELKKHWGHRLQLTHPPLNGASRNGDCAATRSAMALASGDFVVFAKPNDLLHREALRLMAYCLGETPNCDFIYSDQDMISDWGVRVQPLRRPAWSPARPLNRNEVGHLTAFRRELLREFENDPSEEWPERRPEKGPEKGPKTLNGGRDFDVDLKMMSRVRLAIHLPFILYHVRIKSEELLKRSFASTSEK